MEKAFLNEKETKAFGTLLGKSLFQGKSDDADLQEMISFPFPRHLLFQGTLGSGKTSCIQALGKGLGIQESLSSPTFSLLQIFPIFGSPVFTRLVHGDLYRSSSASPLGKEELAEYWNDPKTLIALEWSEFLPSEYPRDYSIWFTFSRTGISSRSLSVARIPKETGAPPL